MRTTVNFAIDLVFALILIALAWTGMVMSFLLPPGTGGRVALWGMGGMTGVTCTSGSQSRQLR